MFAAFLGVVLVFILTVVFVLLATDHFAGKSRGEKSGGKSGKRTWRKVRHPDAELSQRAVAMVPTIPATPVLPFPAHLLPLLSSAPRMRNLEPVYAAIDRYRKRKNLPPLPPTPATTTASTYGTSRLSVLDLLFPHSEASATATAENNNSSSDYSSGSAVSSAVTSSGSPDPFEPGQVPVYVGQSPFSCQTSIVPMTQNQFYLVVQINMNGYEESVYYARTARGKAGGGKRESGAGESPRGSSETLNFEDETAAKEDGELEELPSPVSSSTSSLQSAIFIPPPPSF